MKKLFFCLTIMLAMLAITSCSDAGKDVEQLMNYVPQDAEMVATINLESASDKLKEPLQDLFNSDADNVGLLKCIKNTAVVAFKKGNAVCATFYVDDPKEFQQQMEKQIGKLEKRDGALVGNGIIVKGDQVWVSPNENNDIRHFTEKQDNSYASTEGGKKLIEMKYDISMIASIDLLNANLPNTQYLPMLWNNASYLYIGASVDKKKIEAKCEVLNRKYETASFLLPLKEIDADVVKKLSGNLDFVAAVGYDSSINAMLMPILGGSYSDLLSAIGGTVALGANTGDDSGMLAFQLSESAKEKDIEGAITSLLPGLKNVSVNVDDNCMLVRSGSVEGKFPFDNLLGEAKGAKFMIMCNIAAMQEKSGNLSYQPINEVLLMLRSSDKGAVIELTCYLMEGGLANLTSIQNIFSPTKQQDIPDYDFDEDDQPLIP